MSHGRGRAYSNARSSSYSCRKCKCKECSDQREQVVKIIEKKQGHFQCKNQCCKGRDYNVSFCDTKEISVGEDIPTFFGENE